LQAGDLFLRGVERLGGAHDGFTVFRTARVHGHSLTVSFAFYVREVTAKQMQINAYAL
jgi:hypothetical protein